MSYMKKNINFGLLALLLAMIMVFIGFTLYYQQTFNNLALNYTTKLSQLEKVTKDLSKHKAVLTETKYELNKTELDVEAISTDYADLRNERDELSAELSDTKNTLDRRNSDLAKERRVIRDMNSTIKAKEAEVNKWKGLYESSVSELNECQDDLEDCDDDLDDCEDDLAACES